MGCLTCTFRESCCSARLSRDRGEVCLTWTFRASCCSARLSRDRGLGGMFNVHIQSKLLERRPVTGQGGVRGV